MDFPLDNGTVLKPFDDGHIPETFRCCRNGKEYESSSNLNYSQIVIPKADNEVPIESNNEQKSITDRHCLSVFPNALPTYLTDELYHTTTSQNNANDEIERAWGTYVTIEEAKSYSFANISNLNANSNSITSSEHQNNLHCLKLLKSSLSQEKYKHHLAKAVVSEFLLQKATAVIPSLERDLERNKIHGVAIWALSSDVDNEVQYHIDYAELIRYEYNIIYPPLLAGTIQCSPFNKHHPENKDYENRIRFGKMEGGDFAVNIEGLDHYSEHGYKGKKSQDPMGGYNHESSYQYLPSLFSSSVCHDILTTFKSPSTKRNSSWIEIPYIYNQGIIHHGSYPHLSTSIKQISTPTQHKNENNSNYQRVILGINLFGHDIGAIVKEAPEHSISFRKKVKRMQALSRASQLMLLSDNTIQSNSKNFSMSTDSNKINKTNEKKQNMSGLTTSNDIEINQKDKTDTLVVPLNQIRKNKALTKLLVLAKREKVKQQYQNDKAQTLKDIEKLVSNEKQICILDLIQRLSMRRQTPSKTDISVHIHNWIKTGTFETLGISMKSIVEGDEEIQKGIWDKHGSIRTSCFLVKN